MTEETRKEEKIEKAQEQTEKIENPTELQGEDLEKWPLARLTSKPVPTLILPNSEKELGLSSA